MAGKVKEDYEYFLRVIEKKGESMSLDELLKLKHRVEAAELSKSEKKSLYDGRIGILINEITEGNFFERGKEEARILIERLFKQVKIDERLRTLLSDYLLIAAPGAPPIKGIYRSGKVFSRYAVPQVLAFVEYLHSRTGKTLGLSSLDIKNVKQTTLISFLTTVSESPDTQDGYRKRIMKFRRWLIENYSHDIAVFPYMVQITEKKTLRETIAGRHGRVLTENEVKRVLTYIEDMRAPANEHYWIYTNLLLHCGLRPLHAVMLRVSDVYGAEIVYDVFDRVFYKVPFEERVKTEKKKIQESVHLKNPPSDLYIPPELKDYIEEYVVRNKLSDDDLLISTKIDTIKSKFADIKDRTKIDGLTSTCFRDTWVSVIYCAIGGITTDIVKELGGSKEEETILKHYKSTELVDGTLMTPSRAIGYLKEFNIYFPPAYKEQIALYMKKDVVPISDVEQQDLLHQLMVQVKEQNIEMRKMQEKMVEFEERGERR